MKKTIRSTLLCAVLFLLAVENFAQMTANAQQLKSSASEKKATERKLKDVLSDLKDHYNVDILFFDRYIEEYSVSNDMIRWDKPIEKNLDAVLKSTNLEFKKTKKGGYVISPKKTSQSEDSQDKGLQSSSQMASTSSESLSAVPSTLLQVPGSIQVSGIVKDESGQPLPGTNVIQKGTT